MASRDVVIAYDIVCNKRRRQIHRCLRTWRLDSQYSVFECRLTAGEAEELFLQLQAFMDEKTDRLLLAWLDKKREPEALTTATTLGFKRAAWWTS